jgi:hypothetical protein
MDFPKLPPTTREELINTHLTDSDIAVIIAKLKERVEAYGDVQAAKLLFEFKFGKNPEAPHEGTSLEELMLSGPLQPGNVSDE